MMMVKRLWGEVASSRTAILLGLATAAGILLLVNQPHFAIMLGAGAIGRLAWDALTDTDKEGNDDN